jgi:hypothetical protein
MIVVDNDQMSVFFHHDHETTALSAVPPAAKSLSTGHRLRLAGYANNPIMAISAGRSWKLCRGAGGAVRFAV